MSRDGAQSLFHARASMEALTSRYGDASTWAPQTDLQLLSDASHQAQPISQWSRGPATSPFVYERTVGPLTPATAMSIFARQPYVQSAVNLLSTAIMQAQIQARFQTATGVTEPSARQYPKPVLEFINPQTTPAEFLRDLRAFSQICGVAYVVVEPYYEPTAPNIPFVMIPANPAFMHPIFDKDTGRLRGYEFRSSATDEPLYLPPSQVWEIGGFNPIYAKAPWSPLEPGLDLIQMMRPYAQSLGNFYATQSRLAGFITNEDTMDEMALREKESEFYHRFSDRSYHESRIAFLSGKQKYMPFSTSAPIQSDTGGISPTSILSAQAVSSATGVPVPLILGQMPFEDALAAEATLWTRNLLSFGCQVCQVLQRRLARAATRPFHLHLDTSEVPAMEQVRLIQSRRDVADLNSGIRTPNEIRQDRGELPFGGKFSAYGETPRPVFVQEQQIVKAAPGASPSLSLPGSEGGRDQSETGEAQMVDESGMRAILQE